MQNGGDLCFNQGGLIRNLSPAEMASQIYKMEQNLNHRITNIVLMGSGEPLDNYDNTLKFLNIIHDEKVIIQAIEI